MSNCRNIVTKSRQRVCGNVLRLGELQTRMTLWASGGRDDSACRAPRQEQRLLPTIRSSRGSLQSHHSAQALPQRERQAWGVRRREGVEAEVIARPGASPLATLQNVLLLLLLLLLPVTSVFAKHKGEDVDGRCCCCNYNHICVILFPVLVLL